MSDQATEPQAPVEVAPTQGRTAWEGVWTGRGEPEPEAKPKPQGPSVAQRLEGLVHELGDSLSTERADIAFEKALTAYEEFYDDPAAIASELLREVGAGDPRMAALVEAWAADDVGAVQDWLGEQQQASWQAAQEYGQAAEASRQQAAQERLAETSAAYKEAVAKVEREDPEAWGQHGPQIAALLQSSPELVAVVRSDAEQGLRFALRAAVEGDAAREEARFRDEARSAQWRRDHWFRSGAAEPARPDPIDAVDHFRPEEVIRAGDLETESAYLNRVFRPNAAAQAEWDRSQSALGGLQNRDEERRAEGRSKPLQAFGKPRPRVAPHAARAERPAAPAPRPATTRSREDAERIEGYRAGKKAVGSFIDWSRTR